MQGCFSDIVHQSYVGSKDMNSEMRTISNLHSWNIFAFKIHYYLQKIKVFSLSSIALQFFTSNLHVKNKYDFFSVQLRKNFNLYNENCSYFFNWRGWVRSCKGRGLKKHWLYMQNFLRSKPCLWKYLIFHREKKVFEMASNIINA